jgi:predicted Ser/Thr protein kinase
VTIDGGQAMDEGQLIHPDREQLESFVHGRLSERERERVEQHVSECDSCCDILRSVPHDPLVGLIQQSETSADVAETELAIESATTAKTTSQPGEVPPELIDHPRYRIVKQLGAGGMGVVYQAEHRLMERPVALKVISAQLVNSDVAVERFRLEVKAAARLSHRNIVAAYDAEQAGELHFLVMEFIDGISLAELVQTRGKLSVLHACNYVMQAAQGLQHALENGMVHRDIKPHNLMRTPKGTVKILDFGLARFARQHSAVEDSGLTGDNATLGTPDYIAPEQARDSRRADIRADIYSLGCTLYFLLAGRPPFPRGTAMEKVVAHVERDPNPLADQREDVPEEVIRIVERMMAKEPSQRFQTPAEVVAALKPYGRPADSSANTAADAETAAGEPTATAADTQAPAAATRQPLDQLDLPPLPTPTAVAAHRKRRSRTGTTGPRWWLQHRGRLATAVAALLFLIAVIALLPWLPDLYRSFVSNGNKIAPFEEEVGVTGWIDLLRPVDPDQQTVVGSWRKVDGALTVDATPNARLMLPYQPPREYDFEVVFTRNSGSDSIALHFVDGDGQASFDIDAWMQHLAGIQMIAGRTLEDNPSRVDNQRLENGRTYTAMVRVRRGRVEAYLDGDLLATYEGDGANLSMLELWQLPDSSVLGIGSYASETTFHRIRVRPAGAAGR